MKKDSIDGINGIKYAMIPSFFNRVKVLILDFWQVKDLL